MRLQLKMKALLLFALVPSLLCAAARIARARILSFDSKSNTVVMALEPGEKWVPNTSVCAFEKNRELFCGMIAAVGSETMRVQASEGTQVSTGAWVNLKRMNRDLASVNTAELMEKYSSKTFNLSLGITAGLNYFYPMMQFEVALGRDFSMGLMPLYAKSSDGNSTVEAYGGFFTLSYYYTHFPFRGFYLQTGGGLYNITASVGSNSEQHTQPAILTTMQWRGKAAWELGLDIGVGLGLQYIFPVARSFSDNFSGLLPVINVSIAYPF